MDALLTYVDSNEQFREQYEKYCNKKLDENRYRSYGVLDLQIKGIRKYMPYIKNIFLVVSDKSQVENYNLGNTIILEHKDVIPQEYLPIFNSCSMEMFIWDIPQMDNQFVYFNDDMFVIDNVDSEFFFKDNKPCLSPWRVPIRNKGNGVYNLCCYHSLQTIGNMLDLPREEYKNLIMYQKHCPKPYLKSTCKTVYEANKEEILSRITRVREEKNHLCYIFNDYDYLSGNYNKANINFIYIDAYKFEEEKQKIINKEYPLLCVNDNGKYDTELFKKNLRNILENNLNDSI